MKTVAKAFAHPLVAFVSILTMLFGLLFSGYSDEDSMAEKLASDSYQDSVIVLLLSTIPLSIEVILDAMNTNYTLNRTPQYFGRLMIALTSLLTAVQFKIINHYPSMFHLVVDKGASYVFTLFCLRSILVSSMFYILCASDNTIFKLPQTLFLNILANLTTVFRFFATRYHGWPVITAATLSCITFASIVVLFSYWAYQLMVSYKIMTVKFYTCLLYFFTLIVIAITTYTPTVQQWLKGTFVTVPVTQLSTKNLSLINYGLTVICIIINIVPGRIARYEVYTLMRDNLKLKTEYVRFISHELRTPLNSVFLGLNLAISQLPEDTSNEEDKEGRNILTEVYTACSAALDILNQLLFFDKLENGILELNKSKTRVTELIHDAIKMFTVQIREKNIDMKIQNLVQRHHRSSKSVVLTETYSHIKHDKTSLNLYDGLYMNELIHLDRAKVIQVIRNIVSNAIKFTPIHGSITISMTFECENPNHPQIINSSSKKISSLISSKYFTNSLKTRRSVSPVKIVPCTNTSIHSQHISTSLHSHKSPAKTTPYISTDIGGHTAISTTTNNLYTVESYNESYTYPTPTSTANIHMPNDGYLVIEITDTGAGISEENQQKLFREIVQFNPEILQNGGGSGLGMWISKGIVDLHGGFMNVYSAGEGKGSTFTIKLPMSRVQETYNPPMKIPDYLPFKEYINLFQNSSLRSESKITISNSINTVNENENARSRMRLRQQQSMICDITSPLDDEISDKNSSKDFHMSLSNLSPIMKDSQIIITRPSQKKQIYTILVVDDSSMNRKMVQRILKAKGYICISLESGLEAIEYIQYMQSSIDVLSTTKTIERRKSQSDSTLIGTNTTTDVISYRSNVSPNASLHSSPLYTDIKTPSPINVMSETSYPTSALTNNTTSTEAKIDKLNHAVSFTQGVNDSVALNTYVHVDCIIMDFMMPNMDGPTATAEIRKLGYTGPIIGATGNALQADIDYFIEKGATQVLVKPLSMDLLLSTIEDAIIYNQ